MAACRCLGNAQEETPANLTCETTHFRFATKEFYTT